MSTTQQQSDTNQLTDEEESLFERIRDRYGTDDEVGRIADLVVQSGSMSKEEANS